MRQLLLADVPPARPGVFNDPENYAGIVLDQPFAGAVLLAARGLPGKLDETRPRRILHRGELVFIAGKGVNKAAMPSVRAELVARGIPEGLVDEALAFQGVAVAIARVVNCVPLVAEDYARTLFWDPEDPRWRWVLAEHRALRPFPVQGHQGFVRVPRALVDEAAGEGGVWAG